MMARRNRNQKTHIIVQCIAKADEYFFVMTACCVFYFTLKMTNRFLRPRPQIEIRSKKSAKCELSKRGYKYRIYCIFFWLTSIRRSGDKEGILISFVIKPKNDSFGNDSSKLLPKVTPGYKFIYLRISIGLRNSIRLPELN